MTDARESTPVLYRAGRVITQDGTSPRCLAVAYGRVVAPGSVASLRERWPAAELVDLGSCNRETGHIWFKLELAKKHPDCLEYIVVHEMTHLLARNHGERFVKLMDGFLPNWRSRREQLNSSPLADENWGTCDC